MMTRQETQGLDAESDEIQRGGAPCFVDSDPPPLDVPVLAGGTTRRRGQRKSFRRDFAGDVASAVA